MQRVINGYLKYKYNEDLELYIHEPTSDIVYDSQQVYVDVYEEALYNGVMTEDDILSFMYENGLWTELQDYELKEGLPKEVEDLKVELYKNLYDDLKQGILKLELEEKKKKLNELYIKKNSLTHFTCTGIATLMKHYNTIKLTTKLKNGDIYLGDKCNLLSVMQYKDSNSLLDTDIRNIAKYDQWKAIWQTAKKNGMLFNRSSVDMTDEQKRLTFWSIFYDNIGEHPECPPDTVIEDDDMIDGWAIIQRREREKERGQKNVENKLKNEKIKNASEVFVIASSDKQAEQIESLNSPQNKALKIARNNQLIKNGEMNEGSFADVKQKLYMQAVNKGNEIMKGR